MRWAIGGWSFFIAENYVLSENRDQLCAALGSSQNYHLLYGSVSTVATASIAYAYFYRVRNALPLQWPIAAGAPSGRLAACFALQALGLAGLAQALPKAQIPVVYQGSVDGSVGGSAAASSMEPTPQPVKSAFKIRCPIDFKAEASADGSARGADRVTRHVGLWSFAFVCLGEALAVASVPQAAWLAMPTLVALFGGAHTDSRHARGIGGVLSPEREAQTSNLPFWAILSGKQGSGAMSSFLAEAKLLNAGAAAAIAALWMLRRLP